MEVEITVEGGLTPKATDIEKNRVEIIGLSKNFKRMDGCMSIEHETDRLRI